MNTSGSLALQVREAMAALLPELREGDAFSLVTFSAEARVWVRGAGLRGGGGGAHQHAGARHQRRAPRGAGRCSGSCVPSQSQVTLKILPHSITFLTVTGVINESSIESPAILLLLVARELQMV